jgi:hypothetical protein
VTTPGTTFDTVPGFQPQTKATWPPATMQATAMTSDTRATSSSSSTPTTTGTDYRVGKTALLTGQVRDERPPKLPHSFIDAKQVTKVPKVFVITGAYGLSDAVVTEGQLWPRGSQVVLTRAGTRGGDGGTP